MAKVRSSNICWEALQEDVQQKWLDWRVPILDVWVRWNSTYKMIERALYLWPALEPHLAVDNTPKFSKARTPLTLSLRDWDTLECVSTILSLFVNATEFASGSTYPTLSSQLPYYQFLQNALHELIASERPMEDDPDHTSTTYKICSAADDAYQKLNQNWVKTDSNTGQVIATILDPRMQLQLFKNWQWEANWIENVREEFMRVFTKHYASRERIAIQTRFNEIEVIASTRTGLLLSLETPQKRCCYEALVFVSTDDSLDHNLIESQEEIYLREPRVDRNMHIVQWWKLHKHQLPYLALMARDSLSVHATRYTFHSI